MDLTDSVTERIVTAAILLHAEAGKEMALTSQLTCQSFSGQGQTECQALFDSCLQRLTGEGSIEKGKTGPRLTNAGARLLKAIRVDTDSIGSGLEGQVKSALWTTAGESQAAMFQDRTDGLFSFLKKMEQWPLMKPEAESMRMLLVYRLAQLIEQDPKDRTRKIRDILDLTYSRAVTVKHEIENPKYAKKVDPSKIEWTKIDRGIFHGRVQAWLRTGPLHLNLLRINPRRHPLMTLDCSSFPENERSLKALCERFRAPCGTSGGFFLYSEPDIEEPSRRGDPVGLIVQEGVVTHPPVYARSALIQDREKHVFIRRIGMKGVTIELGDLKFAVRKVNAVPQAGEIAVYTRVYGESTPRAGNLHFSVVGRQVVRVSDGSIPVPLNGFVVVVHSGGADLGLLKRIGPGHPVAYELPCLPGIDRIESAMAGGPALLVNGTKAENLEEDQFGAGLPPVTFCEDSSIGQSLLPRLAWGVTANHELIACAVDGRNFERSVGMTLKQLAAFMLQAGCVDAINLDGGSSKRMVVENRTVDLPGTGFVLESGNPSSRRPLSSAILVMKN